MNNNSKRPESQSTQSEPLGGEGQAQPHAAGPDSLDDVEHLRAALQAARQTIEQLRRANEEARTARWRAEVQQQGRQAERLHALQDLVESQAHTINALRASTSWRITRPLRDSSAWLSRQKTALRRRLPNAGDLPLLPHAEPRLSMAQRYPEWVKLFDTLSAEDIELIQQHLAGAALHPVHVVWQLNEAPVADVLMAIDCLQAQYLQTWSATLQVSDEALAHAAVRAHQRDDARISLATRNAPGPAWSNDASVLFIDRAGSLAPHALYLLAEAAGRTQASVVLGDEDVLDTHGERHSPRFAPRYSRELPTTGSLALLTARTRPSTLDALSPAGSLPHLVASQLEQDARAPAHVPFVLFHARLAPPLQGTENDALPAGEPSQWPFITIIIPTRDRFDLMGPCLTSILEQTDYPRDRYEIVVVDNGSVETELLEHLDALEQAGQIRVIKDPRKFNYARLNNIAVAASEGELLAFVNNDIVVHDALWLQRLAAQAVKPDVGVVGAKLLYPDLTVQHGGVVLGIQGVAAHAHHNLEASAPGYLGLSVNTHAISAITGACIMVRREVFKAVGGFDEKLAVAFNDTLLCMDVLAKGLRNIYVAQPLLIHYESKTRGLDDNEAKRAMFRRESRYARSRYRDLFKEDPYYSPNLSLEHAYDLAFPPRQFKPWHAFRRSAGRMRLLLLSVTHQIGHGVPVVLDIHARYLAQQGHEVIVGGPRGKHDFDYPGCTRVHFETPEEAAVYANVHGVDCVVMHSPPFFSTMRWLGPQIKTVVYDHGEPPPDLFPDASARRHQLIEKDFCLQMADALYANSQATRDESGHARMGVIPLGNTHLAQWNSSMQTRRDDVRRGLELEDKVVVLNVCRFHQGERFYKGIDDYCTVKDRLETEFPEEASRFVFVLVGKGDPDDVEEMENRGLRVFANVSDAQMLDMYCCADLYANFSKWEGYNLGIGQALAMGLEVVASDIPVHRSFPIYTSSMVFEQVSKLVELEAARSPRVARATPWEPSLAMLSAELKALVLGHPH
ncbi:MAG: glycosyltransferase [Comamonadaceae bacterium]|nr:MAG: glycosyltransferase [Comamonadaceae bacterium]